MSNIKLKKIIISPEFFCDFTEFTGDNNFKIDHVEVLKECYDRYNKLYKVDYINNLDMTSCKRLINIIEK